MVQQFKIEGKFSNYTVEALEKRVEEIKDSIRAFVAVLTVGNFSIVASSAAGEGGANGTAGAAAAGGGYGPNATNGSRHEQRRARGLNLRQRALNATGGFNLTDAVECAGLNVRIAFDYPKPNPNPKPSPNPTPNPNPNPADQGLWGDLMKKM